MIPVYRTNEITLRVNNDPNAPHHVTIHFEDNSSSPEVKDDTAKFHLTYCYYVEIRWVKEPLSRKDIFSHVSRYASLITRLHGHAFTNEFLVQSHPDLVKEGFECAAE